MGTQGPNQRPRSGAFGYDRLDRLISAKEGLEAQTYPYVLDDTGNILADGESTYTYEKDRLVRRVPNDDPTGVFTYSYDHFGNQTTATLTTPVSTHVTTTTYDAALHTRRVMAPDGSWVEFAYDGFDRLARRETSGGVVELFFHDRSSQTTTVETDGTGAVKTRYVLASSGEPVAQDQTGIASRGYYVTDPRGNNVQVLDQSKSVKVTFGYDPFGKDRPALTNSAAGWDSRLRYQMAPKDPKTGAYALGPRMYDPAISRFVGADHYAGAAANLALQVDPLTGNAYLYAGANPANLIDDGHHPCKRRRLGHRPCVGRKARGASKPQQGGNGGSAEPTNPVLEAVMGPMPEPGVDCDALARDVISARNAVSGKADKLAGTWKGRGRLETEFAQAQGTLRARYSTYGESKCSGVMLPSDIGGLMAGRAPTPGGNPLGAIASAGGKIFNFGVSGYKDCAYAAVPGAAVGALAGAPFLGGAIGCVGAYGLRLFFTRLGE